MRTQIEAEQRLHTSHSFLQDKPQMPITHKGQEKHLTSRLESKIKARLTFIFYNELKMHFSLIRLINSDKKKSSLCPPFLTVLMKHTFPSACCLPKLKQTSLPIYSLQHQIPLCTPTEKSILKLIQPYSNKR